MSRKRGVTFDDLAKFAVTLPGVEVSTSYGTPALKVKGKFMARLRDDDPDVLVLKPIEDDEQRFLMETRPDVFFKTPHYAGFPSILIRLSKADRAQIEEMVERCWRALAPRKLLEAHDGPVGADRRVRPPRRTITRAKAKR